jgi:hypothetical protein
LRWLAHRGYRNQGDDRYRCERPNSLPAGN